MRYKKFSQKNNIKNPPTGYDYLFTGLLVCAECGRRLSSNSTYYIAKSGERRRNVVYRCERHWQSRACTHKKTISERKVERYLLNNIITSARQWLNDMECKNAGAKKTNPKRKAEKIKNKMERLKHLFLNEAIEFDEFDREYKALKEELAKNAIPEREPDLSAIKRIAELGVDDEYTYADNKTKREFWRELLNELVIDNEGNIKINFKM